jgi:hypothetical protein
MQVFWAAAQGFFATFWSFLNLRPEQGKRGGRVNGEVEPAGISRLAAGALG